MIKIELTPYERSILDTAIKYYTQMNHDVDNAPVFVKVMLEENIKILNEISERMYKK